MLMCHMIADTPLELRHMAETIGVKIRHIQHAGTRREHFDICKAKRELAIAAGAVAVSNRELVRRMK
jgi:hypothetical protein